MTKNQHPRIYPRFYRRYVLAVLNDESDSERFLCGITQGTVLTTCHVESAWRTDREEMALQCAGMLLALYGVTTKIEQFTTNIKVVDPLPSLLPPPAPEIYMPEW